MEKKYASKCNTIVYLLVLIVMFAMLIGTSYAYYVKKIKNGDETRVVIKTANMLMRYKESSEINVADVEPGFEKSMDFSIENYSTDTVGKYKIKLEVISPLIDTTDENFVYELSGTANKNSSNNTLVKLNETPVPVTTTTIGTGIITTETVHDYKFQWKAFPVHLPSRILLLPCILQYIPALHEYYSQVLDLSKNSPQ